MHGQDWPEISRNSYTYTRHSCVCAIRNAQLFINQPLINYLRIPSISIGEEKIRLLVTFFWLQQLFICFDVCLIVSGLPKNGAFFWNRNKWHVVLHIIQCTRYKRHTKRQSKHTAGSWMFFLKNYYTFRSLIDWNHIAEWINK